MLSRKGFTGLEFVILFTVIVLGLVLTRSHMFASIFGEWKKSVDDSGMPYDHRVGKTTGAVTYTYDGESSTYINASNNDNNNDGQTDESSTTSLTTRFYTEDKKGKLTISP